MPDQNGSNRPFELVGEPFQVSQMPQLLPQLPGFPGGNRRKPMAIPMSDIPMSNNASESEMGVPTARTPTITPTIENNNRIMRSSIHISKLGYRHVSGQVSKLYENSHRCEWNAYGIGPLSRGGCDKIVRETQRSTNTTLGTSSTALRNSHFGRAEEIFFQKSRAVCGRFPTCRRSASPIAGE